jgi:hypothetical protein
MRKDTKVCKVLVGKPERKNHSQDQGVYGIRMDLREIGRGGGVDWIQLDQDREELVIHNN